MATATRGGSTAARAFGARDHGRVVRFVGSALPHQIPGIISRYRHLNERSGLDLKIQQRSKLGRVADPELAKWNMGLDEHTS